MKLVILIPTYNEMSNLDRLVSKIMEQPIQSDILIVDDNSPDGTGKKADEISRQNYRVKVLHRPKKEGLGKAYKDAFLWALDHDYDVMFQMDADLSHDPSVLPVFMEKIKDHDAVFGSRYLKGVRVYNWSFSRLLLSKLSNEFIRITLGVDSTDTTTAYKCFTKKVIQAIDISSLKGKQNAFLIELVFKTIRMGFKTTEIPFIFFEREVGTTKMNPKVALESVLTVFKLFFVRLFSRSSKVRS